MKVWKKIIFVVMTILLLNLTIVSSYEQAQASIVSKPLTIAAKKVAKDLAKDSAVEMAEHIAFEKMMQEFLETDLTKVDEGFVPVCMDGAKSYEDCAPNKRAQIKQNLTSGDRSTLTNTVEQVLEQKTNTSAKWQKFLDFFVPIFLLSGLVATFDALLNRDSESFIDEIALQALIDAGLLKPLNTTLESGNIDYQLYNFADVVDTVTITAGQYNVDLLLRFKEGMSFGYQIDRRDSSVIKGTASGSFKLSISGVAGVKRGEGALTGYYGNYFQLDTFNINNFGNSSFALKSRIYENDYIYRDFDEARNKARTEGLSALMNMLQGNVDVSLSMFFSLINTYSGNVTITLPPPTVTPSPTPTPLETDYGVQPGLDKLRNPDGTVPVRGIDSFTFDFNGLPVYPSPDSSTGWRDRTTGEEIPITDEEEIIVEDKIPDPDTGTNPDEEDPPLACAKDLKRIEFKKVGTAFTNAFPFSIPWDIKRFIDNALVGVGSEKPSFNLSFLGDGVTLEIPEYFDGWLPFVHGLIIILFDVSLVYLFYRFMKGGGD